MVKGDKMNIIKKLVSIANELDKKGLYSEAGEIDNVLSKYAEEGLEEPWPPKERWERGMMEMDLSPEKVKKEKMYKKHEVPTDPKDVEELIARTKMLLKGTDYVGEDTEGPQYWAPQEGSEDIGEKYYFGTEGEAEKEFIYPEDMADDTSGPPSSYVDLGEKQPGDKAYFEKAMKKNQQKAFEDWVAGRTFAPSAPPANNNEWMKKRTLVPSSKDKK